MIKHSIIQMSHNSVQSPVTEVTQPLKVMLDWFPTPRLIDCLMHRRMADWFYIHYRTHSRGNPAEGANLDELRILEKLKYITVADPGFPGEGTKL